VVLFFFIPDRLSQTVARTLDFTSVIYHATSDHAVGAYRCKDEARLALPEAGERFINKAITPTTQAAKLDKETLNRLEDSEVVRSVKR
jgi:hypothetical protein